MGSGQLLTETCWIVASGGLKCPSPWATGALVGAKGQEQLHALSFFLVFCASPGRPL